jgi:uncharacterized coiled-coil protein SlyX
MDDLLFMLEERATWLEEKDARINQLSRIVTQLTARCEQLRLANIALLSDNFTAKNSKNCDEGSSQTLPEPLDLP